MTKKKSLTLEDIREMDQHSRETQELVNEHWDELAPQLAAESVPADQDERDGEGDE